MAMAVCSCQPKNHAKETLPENEKREHFNRMNQSVYELRTKTNPD